MYKRLMEKISRELKLFIIPELSLLNSIS